MAPRTPVTRRAGPLHVYGTLAERRMNPIIIHLPDGRSLVDRQTLALVTGRSVNTIRARCPVTEHRRGRALYDLDQAQQTLAAIPPRRR
jgi:hypothetical protein